MENIRYFNERSAIAKEMVKNERKDDCDCDKERQIHIGEDGKIIRPKLGSLPSYIPLS